MDPGASLRIDLDGRTIEIDPPRTLRIGRAADADIRLVGESVSRAHAELRPGPQGWLLVDIGSQHGTFLDGRRVESVEVRSRCTVRCGPEAEAASFHVTPSQSDEADQSGQAGEGVGTVIAPSAAASTGFADTVVLSGLFSGPPGGPPVRSSDGQPEQPRTGPDLLIIANGSERRFDHPGVITVGRHPDSMMVIADPVASRRHGRVDAVPGGWVFTNASDEGTFLEGDPVTSHRIDERTSLRLGHPVAGPELVLVPILSVQEELARTARERRGRGLRRSGLVAATLIAVGALATGIVLASEQEEDASAPVAEEPSASSRGLDLLTTDELDRAKLATVLILAESTDTSGATAVYTGSGSIITSDGLILTNAHVAEPETEGLEERYGENNLTNPPVLLVALVDDPDDSPAAPAFQARVVESDGRIDASIIQIFATAQGEPVQDLDLPTIPIGNSDGLRTGDDVTILGFPGISQSQGVSITTGVISTFVDDPVLGDRAEIDTDARIAPGNSGGLAINNDAEIIGVPSAFFVERGVPIVSGRIRPINVIADLISQVEQ